MSTGQSALTLCDWVAKAGLDVIKVYNTIFYKEIRHLFTFFVLLTFIISNSYKSLKLLFLVPEILEILVA